MVTPTAASGSGPSQRNWKCVLAGMLIDSPAATSTISSCAPSQRHIRPVPERKNQSSSIA
jgi:hypothetical protein